MMMPTPATLARLMPVVALCSCAAPKASVVGPPSAPPQEAAEMADLAEPTSPPLPDDGLRLPDMVTMPGDDELRKTTHAPSPGSDPGTVIARPPTDPPSRPKPADE